MNESFAYQFTSGESSLDKLNGTQSETADQAFQEFSSKEAEENSEALVMPEKNKIEKTRIFRDEDNNLIMGEEDLHRLFNSLARDHEENKIIFEKDLVKKLPSHLTDKMSLGKVKQQSKSGNTHELKFSLD